MMPRRIGWAGYIAYKCRQRNAYRVSVARPEEMTTRNIQMQMER
jgi:hypothetical protein